MISNLILGVSKGYRCKLRLVGVGFRASVINKNLVLKIGYSHEIIYKIPEDITILCGKTKGTLLVIKAKELNKVTQVAAEIRSLRVPDAYKGKGIHYDKEVLVLKKGKREGK
jgi:large subunit ribosomal protein L6